MLIIPQSHLQKIHHHAEKTYPEEGCGLLIGINKDQQKIVTEIWPTENIWSENLSEDFNKISEVKGDKKDRFAIDPKVLLEAQKSTRDRKLIILGIYHSHPDHPAIPSEFDRVIAWPEYSYLIISVKAGKVKDSLLWILNPCHQFESESIIIS